jgi:hypothetical protein
MTPSTGLLIGLPVLTLAALVLAAASFIGIRVACHPSTDDIDAPIWLGGGIVAGLACLSVVIGSLIGFWPYKMEYHAWYPVAGNITSVSQRLVSQGKSMEQRYVVQFTDGRQRACDDTRCSLLKPGMYLELKCIREYQWGGTPGYSCNFVRSHS